MVGKSSDGATTAMVRNSGMAWRASRVRESKVPSAMGREALGVALHDAFPPARTRA
jgi:hypothetical protein